LFYWASVESLTNKIEETALLHIKS